MLCYVVTRKKWHAASTDNAQGSCESAQPSTRLRLESSPLEPASPTSLSRPDKQGRDGEQTGEGVGMEPGFTQAGAKGQWTSGLQLDMQDQSPQETHGLLDLERQTQRGQVPPLRSAALAGTTCPQEVQERTVQPSSCLPYPPAQLPGNGRHTLGPYPAISALRRQWPFP